MPQAGDLDGLSTGDLSMVYPSHGRGNRAANRVIPFPGSILRFPRRGANQIVENRGTLIYSAETLPDRDSSQVRDQASKPVSSPVRVPLVSDNHRRVNHSSD